MLETESIEKMFLRGLSISIVLLLSFGAKGSEQDSATLAQIGDKIISRQALENRLKRLPPEVQARYSGEAGRAAYLRELVRLEVFARAARERGLDRDPEIQARIQDIVNALLAHQYVQRAVLAPVQVQPEEVRNYYQIHRERFVSPERIQAPSILLRVPAKATEVAWKAAEQQAWELVHRLRTGEDFRTLAKTHSADRTAGQYDFHDRFRWVPQVADRIFSLQVGEVSDPIRVSNGYRIFKLLARQPAREQPFQAVAQGIYEQLLRERRDAAYEKAEETLFQRYGVVIRENRTEGAKP